MKKNMSPQKKATVISSSVAILLVIVKLVIGIASGSIAVLASAIDSLLDSVISIFNFFAIKKSEESATKQFQYGKGKIQAIAAVIEGTIITLSGFFIMYKAVEKGLNGSSTTLLLPSIYTMIFSIIVTYALVKYLMKIAKETDNLVIKSDALHYKTDLWSNGVILISLGLVYFTGFDIIDVIFGFAIGIYVIYSAYEILEDGVKILLDHSLESVQVATIGEIISGHREVTSYHWLKTRTDGTSNFIEFHIVLRPNMLLLEAHRIADEIEDKIILIDSRKRWVITPHFDPYDDEEINEAIFNGIKVTPLEQKNG